MTPNKGAGPDSQGSRSHTRPWQVSLVVCARHGTEPVRYKSPIDSANTKTSPTAKGTGSVCQPLLNKDGTRPLLRGQGKGDMGMDGLNIPVIRIAAVPGVWHIKASTDRGQFEVSVARNELNSN
jgi:hypothetical protein